MNMNKLVIALGSAVLLASSLSVSAQVTIKFDISHAPKDGSIPQVCMDEGLILKAEMMKFPMPTKWTFIIACDTQAWDGLMQQAGLDMNGWDRFGETALDHSLTLFRGTALLGMNAKDVTSEHLVAHELAHIFLHSTDEKKVDALATQWINNRNHSDTLVASK